MQVQHVYHCECVLLLIKLRWPKNKSIYDVASDGNDDDSDGHAGSGCDGDAGMACHGMSSETVPDKTFHFSWLDRPSIEHSYSS